MHTLIEYFKDLHCNVNFSQCIRCLDFATYGWTFVEGKKLKALKQVHHLASSRKQFYAIDTMQQRKQINYNDWFIPPGLCLLWFLDLSGLSLSFVNCSFQYMCFLAFIEVVFLLINLIVICNVYITLIVVSLINYEQSLS